MATFVVSYDLNKDKNYQKLWDELKRLGGHKALLSVYFVNVNNTAKELLDHLKGYVDDDDTLLVAEFNSRNKIATYKARQGTKDWLDANT